MKDDRVGCIAPNGKFQVFKGGQNVTCQPYNAISQTTANHVYNVTVPSLDTIISREVLWRSTVTLKLTVTNKAASALAVNYGVTDALAPFPLNSLVNVMSVTINNNAVSQNMQEPLPIIIRMVVPEELSKYNSMTPTALDYLANYEDAVQPLKFHIDSTEIGGGPIVYYPAAAETEPAAPNFLGSRPAS